MSIAEDTRRMFALPTPIDEVDVGDEFDAGVGYLVRATEIDTAAERDEAGGIVHVVTLTFEDMAGERREFTRPAGTEVTVYLPYRSAPSAGRARCRTAHDVFVAGWEDAAALPAPSDAVLDRLALLWRPYLSPAATEEAA